MNNKKYLFIITPLLALALLVQFLLPVVVEKKLKQISREQFALDVTFDKFALNPFLLQFELDNLSVKDANSSQLLISNKKLFVDLSYSSLKTLSPVVNTIKLDTLYVNIERDHHGRINFEKYIPNKKPQTISQNESKSYFEIKDVSIKNSSLHLVDSMFDINENIQNINFVASNISNFDSKQDTKLDANLSLQLLDGGVLFATSSKPFKKITEFSLSLKADKISLDKFKKLLPPQIERLQGKFFCDINAKCVVSKEIKGTLSGKAGLDSFSLSIPKKSVAGQSLAVEVENFDFEHTDEAKKNLLSAKNIVIKNHAVDFKDQSTPKPLKIVIKDSSFRLSNFMLSEKNSSANIDASVAIAPDTQFTCKGDVDLIKRNFKFDLNLQNFSILPIKSFAILPPRVDLASGFLHAKGALSGSFEDNKTSIKYDGGSHLSKLMVYDSLTHKQALAFDNLDVVGIAFDTLKNGIKVISISLDGLKTDLIIDKQKQVNIVNLLENNVSKATTIDTNKSISKPKFGVDIGSITIQNGSISFLDEHVEPNFKANLTQLSGKVSSLSLNKNQLSKIELIGLFNAQGHINIKGLLIPNEDNFYLNVKSDVKDIGLTSFSSYTSRYIGHEIDSGKLGLELDYNVAGKDMSLSNKISLFGFNLGREVESPNAKKLPYNLAIAILKDSNDNIHIELPVEGRTDDPQVKSGKVIWKFVSQLVTKVITSPFRFIGSMFGGGEQMGMVEFEFGDSQIARVQEQKILKIVKLLDEKPNLIVQIHGFVDGENDLEALTKLEFQKKLAIQKLLELKKPVDNWYLTKIEPGEYEKYLKKAYKAEKFAKPTNAFGFAKDIPSEDMKNLIQTNIEISEDDLLRLSEARANSVKSMLINSGIDSGRLNINKTKLAAPDDKEGVKKSRVELMLTIK